MRTVTFEVPDDMIVLKGVCIVTGWTEDNKPQMYAAHLEDTHVWEQAMLYREGLRRSDARMNQMWQRTDG